MSQVLKRLCTRLRRDRRGGILTLSALMLPVLILITALCVDLGILYLSKTKAEIAATMAAEAAEQRLPDIAGAQALGEQVALAMLDDVTFASDYDIQVSVTTTQVDVTVHLRMKTILARFADVDILDSYGSAHRPLP